MVGCPAFPACAHQITASRQPTQSTIHAQTSQRLGRQPGDGSAVRRVQGGAGQDTPRTHPTAHGHKRKTADAAPRGMRGGRGRWTAGPQGAQVRVAHDLRERPGAHRGSAGRRGLHARSLRCGRNDGRRVPSDSQRRPSLQGTAASRRHGAQSHHRGEQAPRARHGGCGTHRHLRHARPVER